ncbi:MAG: TonB family protein [Candidatus Acidiferrales bacterium]
MRHVLRLAVLCCLAAAGAAAQDQGAASGGPPPPDSSVQQAPSAQKPMRIRVSGNVAAAKLRHVVTPSYPESAKTSHIEGTVVLHCIIARDGTVQQIEFVSGPPLLLKAAMDAVRQWTYEPTLLNGEAIEVDTRVNVVFTLGGEVSDGAAQQEAAPDATKKSDSVTTIVPATPIDPTFKADILRLMSLTHFKEKQEAAMRKIFEPMRPTLLATIPVTPNREKILDAYISRLTGLVESDDFMDRLTSVYAQYLTDDDVNAASAFYETPSGQRYLENSTKMMPQIFLMGERLATDNIPSILKQLCKEYPELQGEAKFCGASDPSRKSLLLAPDPSPFGN